MTDKELNALIGDKIMGGKHGPRWCYNIAAAWFVVERLFELGWDVELEGFSGHPERKLKWRVRVAQIDHQEMCELAFSESAPRAICEAALSAICGVASSAEEGK